MRRMTIAAMAATFLCSFGAIAQQKQQLRLADALQANMVIQQNKPLKIWGWQEAGKPVRIQADWMGDAITVVADRENRFLGIIPVPGAKAGNFTLHRITVSSDAETTTLDSLLIGDVWFCSGQSNMQFPVKESLDSAAEVPTANYPNIRLLNASLNFSATPIDHFQGKWVKCTPATVQGFSAVGYFFGKELYTSLQVPIGIIFSGIGASAAQAWVPRDVLAADTQLNRVYLLPYLNSERSKEKIDGGFSFEKVTRPFLLYNAMIHPFTNLSIKGFCWYQGESNRNERESYTRLTQALIKSWRMQFSQDNLPFYYVQVAPFYYDKEDPALADYAFFREAQEKVSELNNTGMVVTMDVGEAKDLHPKNKKPIGIRMARMALNRTYGWLDIAFEGPRYSWSAISGRKMIIHFTAGSIAGGLQTKDGKAPAFFTIAGDDGLFYPAQATIVNNTIVVSSDKVKNPVAVRYAFTNYPVTNLQNGKGFPAVPFRTDTWTEK